MRKIPTVYDNGGETLDRYTIIYTCRPFRGNRRKYWEYIASCETGAGYWQHGELNEAPGPYLGKRMPFENLPDSVQRRYNREAGFASVVTVQVQDKPGIW